MLPQDDNVSNRSLIVSSTHCADDYRNSEGVEEEAEQSSDGSGNPDDESRNLRVTPAQDTIVRRVLSDTGTSLNEYVVSRTVAAATNDLADRRIFVLEPHACDELEELLNRPPAPNPRITSLLTEPSTLEDV